MTSPVSDNKMPIISAPKAQKKITAGEGGNGSKIKFFSKDGMEFTSAGSPVLASLGNNYAKLKALLKMNPEGIILQVGRKSYLVRGEERPQTGRSNNAPSLGQDIKKGLIKTAIEINKFREENTPGLPKFERPKFAAESMSEGLKKSGIAPKKNN